MSNSKDSEGTPTPNGDTKLQGVHIRGVISAAIFVRTDDEEGALNTAHDLLAKHIESNRGPCNTLVLTDAETTDLYEADPDCVGETYTQEERILDEIRKVLNGRKLAVVRELKVQPDDSGILHVALFLEEEEEEEPTIETATGTLDELAACCETMITDSGEGDA